MWFPVLLWDMSDDARFDADDARLRELERKVDRGEELTEQEESELEKIVARFHDHSANSLSDIRAAGTQKAADLTDEFEERLKQIESKATGARARQNTGIANQTKSRVSDGESARGLGIGLSIAYTIIGLPLVGVAIGWFLDNRLGTKIWIQVGVLGGSVAGLAMAFLMINRNNDKT